MSSHVFIRGNVIKFRQHMVYIQTRYISQLDHNNTLPFTLHSPDRAEISLLSPFRSVIFHESTRTTCDPTYSIHVSSSLASFYSDTSRLQTYFALAHFQHYKCNTLIFYSAFQLALQIDTLNWSFVCPELDLYIFAYMES